MIAVLVRFSINSEFAGTARELAVGIAAAMRDVVGCTHFELLASEDGSTIVFDERWIDRPAWERSMAERPPAVLPLLKELAAHFAAPPAHEVFDALPI